MVSDAQKTYIAVACSGLCSAVMIWLAMGFFLMDVDDGVFAYLALQVLGGSVYGVDVIDTHAGYHTFVNALMYKWFGADVLHLRYPVLALQSIQAMIVTYLLRHKGLTWAFLGGVLVTSLGMVRFMSASPVWYCLFFAIVSVLLLTEMRSSWQRNIALGLLIGLSLLFRHPSGIFLGFGVLFYLIYESRSLAVAVWHRSWLSYFLLALIGISLTVYTYIAFAPLAFFMFGVGPLLLLGWLMTAQWSYNNKEVFKKICICGLGVLLALLPMIAYQLIYGDLVLWFKNVFLTGHNVLAYESFYDFQYWDIVLKTIEEYVAVAPGYAIALVVYWIVLLSVPVVVLWHVGQRLKTAFSQTIPLSPLLVIAVFYGYNSFYLQMPFYFYASAALFVLYVLVSVNLSRSMRPFYILGIITMCFIGYVFDTPFTAGHLVGGLAPSNLPGVGVSVVPENEELWTELAQAITSHSEEGESLFVFPQNPLLYVITNRESPLPHWGTVFTPHDERSYQKFVQDIDQTPPQVYVYVRNQLFMSTYNERFLERIQADPRYKLVAATSGYEVFARQDDLEILDTGTKDSSPAGLE